MSKVPFTIYDGWYYDNLLTQEQCKYYQKTIDDLARKEGENKPGYFQDILKLSRTANDLWNIIKNDLPKKLTRKNKIYELAGLSDHLTVSRHKGRHIGIHQDKDVKVQIKGVNVKGLYCFFKLGIYLNDLSNPSDPNDKTGGTSFYDENKNFIDTLKPKTGRGVLFDMREWHSGAHVPDGLTKYMLGARPLYKVIQEKVEEKQLESIPLKVIDSPVYSPYKEYKEHKENRENRENKYRSYQKRKYCSRCGRYHSSSK